MSGEAKKGPRPAVVPLLIIFGFAVVFFAPIRCGRDRKAPKAESKTAVAGFVLAMKSYSNEYGFPVSGTLAQIQSTLRGDNPRKIIFIEFREGRVNAQGEYLDPWGSPYRFDISKPDAPRVWSCGPNRKDEMGAEGSDDIVSWR